MKINSVSNLSYTPDIAKRDSAAGARSAPTGQKTQGSVDSASSHNGLTGAERAFFAKLFPDSTPQISSHKTYSPSGVHASVEPGQIINRKV